MMYDFNDILIQPAPTTSVRSRSQVNPYYSEFIEQGVYSKGLPLMTAPMDTHPRGTHMPKAISQIGGAGVYHM